MITLQLLGKQATEKSVDWSRDKHCKTTSVSVLLTLFLHSYFTATWGLSNHCPSGSDNSFPDLLHYLGTIV